nr:AMP-dependent synthetase and ligase [uncultured bacterium]
MLREAEHVLGGLRSLGLAPGDCVLLQLADHEQILPALWGCLLGGFVPVVAAVPADLSESSRAIDQLKKTWDLLDSPVVITTQTLEAERALLAKRWSVDSDRLPTFEQLLAHQSDTRHHASQPDDTALFSLTSGSTGLPKCVNLTHRNLLSRAYGANQLGRHALSDVILNWLPLDHIGSISDWHLRCVLLGCRMIYAAKAEILARPLRWLELIAEHRVTHTWAPNFAYALIVDALKQNAGRSWDLSSVEAFLTAGENVSPAVARQFLDLLAPCKLKPTAIRPAFGMAEMGSGVTYRCATESEPVRVFYARRESLGGALARCEPADSDAVGLVSLGPPIPGIALRIVNEEGDILPETTVGLLQVRGAAVANGYFRNPEASAVFHSDGWFDTGDLGFLSQGELYLTGRAKDTIIIHGANFSCSEIEEVVQSIAGVEPSFTAACAVRKGHDHESLALFFHTSFSQREELTPLVKQIRREVVRQVGVNPEYLLPVPADAIPKTAIGKIQRRQLREELESGAFDEVIANVNELLHREMPASAEAAPHTEIERQVAEIWKSALGLESVRVDQNVFELGAHSLLLVQIHSRLEAALGRKLSVVELFQYPTIQQLAGFLSGQTDQHGPLKLGRQRAARRQGGSSAAGAGGVAVIGMACRYPGANNIEEFWRNLRDGIESIAQFSDQEIQGSGIDPERAQNPKYVKAGPVLPGVELFDAEFFGYTAREAELMDPQQRLLLECAWEAMENAGYNLLAYDGAIGVYAGAMLNTYLLNQVLAGGRHLAEADRSEVLTPDSLAGFLTMVANDKDYLTTRVSYKLNLRGPSVNVQTACSTSLVAIHMAASSILMGECDVALAGGVAVKVPQETGYLYEDDLIVSPDGHCRPFDAKAQGTVFGNGAGLVVLKRLDQALADRDHIYAVIRGSAVNNDGARKVGYMAPSQDGQAAVVAEALAMAGVLPESIGFVEAHGTATALGDPIEVAGLTHVFRESTNKSGYCALGSVKGNVGHLQIASGVVGFMKAALSLYHKEIPPSLHFQTPNPRINFSQTPFYVNDRLTPWANGAEPRRASVNSLGIGGTNAHVILEEAPALAPTVPAADRSVHLLALSAKSEAALRQLAGRYRDFLTANPNLALADVCYTANCGRIHFAHRAAFRAATTEEICQQLAAVAAGHDADGALLGHANVPPPLADLPGGQGDWEQTLTALATLYVNGGTFDWKAWDGAYVRRRVPLPTYPFQRQRYWIERPRKARRDSGASALPSRSLLGISVRSQRANETVFETQLSTEAFPFLSEHRFFEQPVAPLALYLSLLVEAAQETAGSPQCQVTDLRLPNVLPIPEERPSRVQLVLQPNAEGARVFQVLSLASSESTPPARLTLHASGRLQAGERSELPAWATGDAPIEKVQARCQQHESGEEFYRRIDKLGVQLGPSFRTVHSVWTNRDEALGRVDLSHSLNDEAKATVHPTLLDATLQIAAGLMARDADCTRIPVSLGSFTFIQVPAARSLWCHVRLCRSAASGLVADAVLWDDVGAPVAFFEAIRYEAVPHERLRQLIEGTSESVTSSAVALKRHSSTPAERVLTSLTSHHVEQVGMTPRPSTPNDRQRLLVEFIRQEIGKAIGSRSWQSLPMDRGFVDLGMDSLTSVELRNRLQQSLSCSLPATVLFDYPTINQLVTMLLQRPDVKIPKLVGMSAVTAPTEIAAADLPAIAAPPATPGNGAPRFQPKPPRDAAPPEEKRASSAVMPPLPSAASAGKRAADGRREQFAIVGMACRFPGSGNSPEQYWSFLERGGDASREVPSDRFNIDAHYDSDRSVPGKMATRHGCFLDSVNHFDASFFGVAPREAHMLDPQQRLLLEVGYEALENAGIAPDQLEGSPTGVFVGISSIDYAVLTTHDHSRVGPYFGTGTAHATACGRLSYFLGLQGPCFSVDTACSSSLVAVHLACQSLAAGECDMALAAGVNLVTAPEFMISFSKAQMLSADGRCKTFDASADGYVRGEGVGVLVIKRLSAAIKNNDPILAVIRGSAVNQDGKSSGLTVPSGPAQEKVIQSALAAAGVAPEQVSYVEAHGTGTPLGDSIELGALRAVYGAGRAEPLIVGSVKTNIGHTEAASGVAGLIKVILALKHRQIPRHLHFQTPNLHVEWEGLRVPTELLPWQPSSATRLAGVSSFGFGGTNAHIILEEAPAHLVTQPSYQSSSGRPFHLLTLSAKAPAALGELASRYAEHLKESGTGLEATCAGALFSRGQWPERVAVIAASAEDAAAKLTELGRARDVAGIVQGEASDLPPQIALLFTGQGSQYAGMGRELYETQPIFRRELDRCEELLRPYLPQSLLSVLYPALGESALLDQTAFTQPALFALEHSLWELWKSWGLQPSVFMGHSVGEYVAACAAGVFDLEDGLRLIATRARLVQSLPPGGEMCAVMASLEWVQQVLAAVGGKAGVAAINGPRQVVVSGEHDAVATIIRAAEADGIRTKLLPVSHAFHSHLLEPILDEFYAVASSVTFRPPTLTIISNLTGEPATDDIATPEYWCQHLRHPVQFVRSMQTAAALGCEIFLEAGPQATLTAMGRQCLSDERYRWLPSLSNRASDWQTILTSLATLYVRGVPIAWEQLYDKRLARQQALPNYPFQRQRYWLPEPSADRSNVTRPTANSVHPLLGVETRLPGGGAVYHSQLGAASPAYLADHQVQGTPLFPAAGFVEAFVAAGRRLSRSQHVQIQNVEFARALPWSTQREEQIELLLTRDGDQHKAEFFRRVAATSAENGEPSWVLHAAGRFSAAAGQAPAGDLDAVRARMSLEQPTDEYYRDIHEDGMEYGPAFQRLCRLWRGGGEALGQWESSPAIAALLDQYTMHPALLDAAFQVVGAVITETGSTHLPVGVEKIEVFDRLPPSGYSHVRLRESGNGHRDLLLADLNLMDLDGRIVTRITGFRLRKISRDVLRQSVPDRSDEWLYDVMWKPRPHDSRQTLDDVGSWLVIGGHSPLTTEVANQLRQENQRVVVATCGRHYREYGPEQIELNPCVKEDFQRLLSDVLDEMAPPLLGVVLLASDLGQTHVAKQNGDDSPAADSSYLPTATLHLVQALGAAEKARACRLWLVTSGAVALSESERVPGVAQSPLWGLGGVVAAEHPELGCVRVDLDSTSDPNAAAADLLSELVTADGEDRVAYRSGERYAARLRRYRGPSTGGLARPAGPYRLQLTEYGVLENLQLAPLARRAPLPGEVEIAVAAAGLNFRDVLRALGMLQPFEIPLGITSAAEAPFGFECAGVIVAVGEGVAEFCVGQEVVGVALGAMRSHVTTRANQVALKPASLSMIEAATLPLPFLTASYALETLANIQPGQRVLIHAAAGGVGLAAVQIAQQRGAEVWATASPSKWDFLKSLGVKHVFNSRTLAFADEILCETGGGGVDVILNSLTGDFIPASLKSLRAGGTFIEIGKLGIWSAGEMAGQRPDVRYHAFDLGEEEDREPGLMGRLLNELLPRLVPGALSPLPHRVFPLTQAVQAFRHVAQAKHRGKIVLTLDEQPAKLSLRTDGWYLVTGGLGALGLKTAQWLSEQGAKRLALIGRQSPQSDDQHKVLTEIATRGTEVELLHADVSDRAALAQALSLIPGPICGVIHAAGVLDDGTISQLDAHRLDKVLAPKVRGGWNLHELTRGQPVDFFVCFSSAAALLGSPGQGNYAAANAYLDALAHHRRALGLPALSVNWGPWSGTGMAARLSDRDRQRLAAMGLGSIEPQTGLRLLTQLLLDELPQAAVLPIEWNRFLKGPTTPPFYHDVAADTPRRQKTSQEVANVLSELRTTDADQRKSRMIDYLRAEIAAVLGFEAQAISPRGRLFDLGMDSLTAVEMQNRLQRGLAIDLPTTLAFDYPTVEALAPYLLDRLGLAAAVVTEKQDKTDHRLAEQVEQYSDEEVESLLRDKYQDVLRG